MEFIKQYKITCKPLPGETIYFRYFPGAVLRNGINQAMGYLCENGKVADCNICHQQAVCVYAGLNLHFRQNQVRLPQPFAIDPLKISLYDKYSDTSTFSFKLVLFGKANNYLEQWEAAINKLGREIGIGNRNVGSKERSKFGIVSFEEEKQCSTSQRNIEKALVEFDSILFSKDVLKNRQLDFEYLLELIADRLKELKNHYADNDNKCNIEPASELRELAKKIKTEHYNFYKSYMPYPPGGNMKKYTIYKGTAEYKGSIDPFVQLLDIGRIIGVKQFTSGGFGRYRLSYG